MILNTIADFLEIQYNYGKLRSQAATLKNISSSLQNYSYNLSFTTSAGATVDQLQQTCTELKEIGLALSELAAVTATVVANAAEEMAKAEAAATIQIIRDSSGGK